MKTEEELTFSQNKTKLTIYRLIGRKKFLNLGKVLEES